MIIRMRTSEILAGSQKKAVNELCWALTPESAQKYTAAKFHSTRSLVVLTQRLFPVAVTRRQRGCSSCAVDMSLRNSKWDLPLQSCPPNCSTRKPLSLKGSARSSPTSCCFSSPSLLTAPLGGRFSPSGWLWVPGWQMGLLTWRRWEAGGTQETETTVFPLISKCPVHKPAEKTLHGFQSPAWRSIWVQISSSRQLQ